MKNISPPKFAEQLLLRFLRHDLAEEVLGDLGESFYVIAKEKSVFRARLNYWFQAINYLRPFAFKNKIFRNLTSTAMYRHTLLMSFRHFSRYKSSFFINLIGLSSGLACTLLIFLWVNDELSIDKFHEKNTRLYQVLKNGMRGEELVTSRAQSDLLAEAMAKDFPEVELASSITPSEWFGNIAIEHGQKKVKGIGQFADKDFFKIFSFPLLQGNAALVLQDKNSIVISKALAERLYGSPENVVGKNIEFQILSFRHAVTISGVFADASRNSSEKFEFVMNWDLWKEMSAEIGREINWDNNGPYAYLVLKEGTDLKKFNAKIENYLSTKLNENKDKLFVVPYSDQYLYGTYKNGVQSGGRIEYVKLFSAIAFFILAIACINYMNLATARASRHAKEAGVKKTLGVSRFALASQYLTESMLLVIISVIIALGAVVMLLPQFNLLTGKQLILQINSELLVGIGAITLITGFLSGSYPALYLSRINPLMLLQQKFSNSISELLARKGLVVFQFTLSVLLIVSVTVIYKQIDFLQTKNLGYDKDHIIYFRQEGNVTTSQEAFLNQLKKVGGVVSAALSGSNLIGANSSTFGIHWDGKNPDDNIAFEVVGSSYDLIETLGIEMKEGRAFSRDFADSDKLIFNETAIEAMKLKDPIGKNVTMWNRKSQIVGVVKDFHFQSLHEKVKPLVFMLSPKQTLEVMVRIAAGEERETIGNLEKFYKQFNPGISFDYHFMNKDYEAQYSSEHRVAALSRYFAGLAIIISCLGLFGLASFSAERRQKEIGIRKILGLNEWGVVYLLSSDFTKMVVLAIGIALPTSYFLSQNWLSGFAFHIELKWWYFVAAGLTALMVAWLTIGIQLVKAARLNPVSTLKIK